MAVAVALAAGSFALGAVVAVPSSAAMGACGPAPSGQVAVAMVVDAGGGMPSPRCAVVTQGSTGLDALRAAGHSVRLDGGFVCAIDGLPATGCGNRPDSGLAYWRYWHAAPGGGWSYSQVGAGGYRLPARCAVEGWVWSDAPSSNTPPRIAAPAPTCDAPSPTAPPATSAPASRPPTTAASPGSGGSGTDSSGTPTPGATPGAPATSPGGGPTTVPAAVAGVTTVAPGAVTPTAEGDAVGADQDRSGQDGQRPTGSADRAEQASAGGPVGSTGTGGSSTPWGLVVAVVLVAGLGGAALLRSRTRSA